MSKTKRFGQANCVSVRSLYDNFLRTVTALFGKYGVGLTQNPTERLSVELRGIDRIELQTKRESGLWISGLPRYKGNKSNVIDVCLSLDQNITLDEKGGLILAASNVHVSYFARPRPNRYKILESWHFDYAPNADGHPVFHAQLTEDHYPPASKLHNYKPKHRIPELKDLPRIPTPPLGLASVLEMLAADHLDYKAIVDSESWQKTAASLPQLPMSQLTRSKFCSDKLKARHWYPAP